MELEIFADETHVTDNMGKEYLGIGCLFVPVYYKYLLSKKLSNLRCLNENSKTWSWEYDECRYSCKENYHQINDCEIHFTNIEKNMSPFKLKIYEKWTKFVINHNKFEKDKNILLYFIILYLDLEKLDFNVFGVDKDTTNIYNRFFRTVILSARSYYFKNQVLTIKNIYHDNADEKEVHDYFNWHTLNYLNNYKRINIKTDEITFINSNHRYYDNPSEKENSQFIQLIDLILGCSNQILFANSKDKNKIKIAGDFYPLFKRLWKRPYNFNSQYNYMRSQQVSIFPKTKIKSQIDLDGLFMDTSQFHNDLKISDPKSLIEQVTLDSWF